MPRRGKPVDDAQRHARHSDRPRRGTEGCLDIDRDGITVCKGDQSKDIDLVVQADTGQMYKWLARIATFRELVSSGHARPIGPSRLTRASPIWFTPLPFGDQLRRSARRLQTRPA